MTTKYITTYIAAGYTLSPVYSTLSITSTGGVGGTGIYASEKATIINDGRIVARYSDSSFAIDLRRGGEVINGGPSDTSAYIYGRIGSHSSHAVNVENYGTIDGEIFIHSSLTNGSSIDQSAVITGQIDFGVAKKPINPEKITITNFGSINGFIEGVAGTVVNGSSTDTSANIDGSIWLQSGFESLSRAPGTVSNYGTVINSRTGYRSGGVNLGYEGMVVNGSALDTAALISGSSYGVFMAPGDSLLNFGTIEGRTSHYGYGGVSGCGYLINGAGSHSSALISGEIGVRQSTGEFNLQISNFGTISGANSVNGAGIYFYGVSSLTNGSATNHSALVEGYSGVLMRGGSSITNLGTIAALGSARSYGVLMKYGEQSTLINGATDDAKATIEGFTGVQAQSGATFMTVTNFGTIKGGRGGGVDFESSTDSLIVEAGSRIKGFVYGGGGTLDFDTGTGNLVGLPGGGTITASGDTSPGTAFHAFGTLEIGKTASFSLPGGGSINVGQNVIDMGDFTVSGTVTNNGAITVDGGAMIVDGAVVGAGAHGYGIVLADGGTVVNGSHKSLIEGATGVLASGGSASTVINYGTIDGTGGVAVQLSSAADRLDARAQSDFVGLAKGGGGTLELTGGMGSITGIGGVGLASGSVTLNFTAFGAYVFDGADAWTMTGTNTLASGQSLTDAGSLTISGTLANGGTVTAAMGGTLMVETTLANTGMLIAEGTLIAEGAVTGAGVAEINNAGTLSFLSTFNEAVNFLGLGTLGLSDSQDYSGQVAGFSTTGGAELDLGDIGFVGAGEATFSGTATSGVLTVTDGLHTANINLLGDYLTTTFVTASDGHGGTDVTAQSTDRPAAPPHAFIAAMAGLGASMASHVAPGQTWAARGPLLIAPRVAIA